MREIVKIYEEAVLYYNNLADLIEDVYNSMKKAGLAKITKKQLMNDYDLYIQSLLIKVAKGDDNFDKTEYEFIRKIVRYKDNLSGYKFKGETLDDKIELDIQHLSENTLQQVPLFIQMLAAYDKALEENGKEQMFSQLTFETLLRLLMCISRIDMQVEQNEIIQACSGLETVIDFFKVNNIKFLK